MGKIIESTLVSLDGVIEDRRYLSARDNLNNDNND
jgi:hypothetical protein